MLSNHPFSTDPGYLVGFILTNLNVPFLNGMSKLALNIKSVCAVSEAESSRMRKTASDALQTLLRLHFLVGGIQVKMKSGEELVENRLY